MRALRYGDHPEQTGDLHLPAGEPRGAVVLWHGGGFAAEYTRAMMEPLARELARRGLAVYNATYRRLDCGGGVPATFDDAVAAAEALVIELDLDERPAGVGLSAGAPLALHAAAQGRLSRVVDIAGVVGLALAVRSVGEASSARRLFGAGPDEAPELYAAFDPMANAPLDVPVLIVHGDADEVVPLALSRAYAERSGGELVVVPGAGHFDLHGRTAPAPPELLAFLGAGG